MLRRIVYVACEVSNNQSTHYTVVLSFMYNQNKAPNFEIFHGRVQAVNKFLPKIFTHIHVENITIIFFSQAGGLFSNITSKFKLLFSKEIL